MRILSAASPVEIEACADNLARSAPARTAALSLFHDLTSREELEAMALPASMQGHHDGTAWPAHRFLFGETADLAPTLDLLRRRPDVAEIGSGDAPEDLVPRTLLLTGYRDGFCGLLLACTDPERLAEVRGALATVFTHFTLALSTL
jgi:hypothetical protein